jgi:hypothetical protein
LSSASPAKDARFSHNDSDDTDDDNNDERERFFWCFFRVALLEQIGLVIATALFVFLSLDNNTRKLSSSSTSSWSRWSLPAWFPLLFLFMNLNEGVSEEEEEDDDDIITGLAPPNAQNGISVQHWLV